MFFLGDNLLLYLFAIAIVLIAQGLMQASYRKYRNIETIHRQTGAEVARKILEVNGLYDVDIIRSEGGKLSDHYDPTNNTVALSEEVYSGTSIASVAIAAHEVGHALQHANGYKFIEVRNSILPFAITAGNLSWGVIMIGLFFPMFRSLLWIGIAMLAVIALFQLVTLPVEFDASNRALKMIEQYQLLDISEFKGAKKMLRAAAFTYVAALIGTVVQILRFVLIASGGRSRD